MGFISYKGIHNENIINKTTEYEHLFFQSIDLLIIKKGI